MKQLPPADLSFLAERLDALGAELLEAFEEAGRAPVGRETAPEVLLDSVNRLLDLLRNLEADEAIQEHGFEARDINALGNHGLQSLQDLAAWAVELRQPGAYDQLRILSFSLSLWLARQGAELSRLQAVVDALAFVANLVRDPAEQERLYQAAVELMDAAPPLLAQDLEPSRPWRMLILNQARIATRSHQPALMEKAFRILTEALPEDAANFFREGMEQIDALEYPPQVREVMEEYYQLWGPPKTLH